MIQVLQLLVYKLKQFMNLIFTYSNNMKLHLTPHVPTMPQETLWYKN